MQLLVIVLVSCVGSTAKTENDYFAEGHTFVSCVQCSGSVFSSEHTLSILSYQELKQWYKSVLFTHLKLEQLIRAHREHRMSYPPPYSEQPPYAPGGQSMPQPHAYPPPQNQGGSSYPPPYPQPQAYGYPPPAVQPTGHFGPPPIVQQPGPGAKQQYAPPPGDGWIPLPQHIPVNSPPGLQYLATVDSLFIKQKVELLEAFVGFETNNKYTIKNNHGQKVYHAIEENDCCTRNCCGPSRSFDLRILDHMQTEVIHVRRELACDSCWFPCCLQVLEVFSPPGNRIGTVEQTWSICTPEFDIKNESGQTVLKLEGPVCRYGACGNVEFKVLSNDKSAVVGKISKQWGGLIREMFTDADAFGISFPIDLDVRMKAVMVGAAFLIDFMFFEKSANEEGDGCGMF